MACWTNQAQQIFCFLSKSLLFDRKYPMSFIIERHFWPPFCFFGDIIDNKKTSVSLHGWDRPRGNQSCPLGPILGHEKWKFQGDVDHHLCCAFSLCLISLLYSQRVFSRYQIYISSYIFEIIRIMCTRETKEIQLHILFIFYSWVIIVSYTMALNSILYQWYFVSTLRKIVLEIEKEFA